MFAKISVIIPIYNVEKYLDRCLKSVCEQKYKNLEIILVDDGSTDSSYTIANKWAKIDNRILLFRKSNGGLSDARNYGIKKATGEYISFIDSDDFIESDMYSLLMDGILKDDSDLSICSYYLYNEKDGSVKYISDNDTCARKVLASKDALKLLCKNEIESHVWDKLYKKELFDDVWFPVGKYFEDIYIMHKIFMKTTKISLTYVPKYYYVQRQNSICDSLNVKSAKDYLGAFLKRFYDLEIYLDYFEMVDLFNVIYETYFFLAKKKEFYINLSSIYKEIVFLSKKYNINKKLSRKNKIKISLNILGVKPYLQYKMYNALKFRNS